MKKSSKNAGIVLMVIGLITIMKVVNKFIEEQPLRASEYVLAVCGLILFSLGIYAIRKASKASNS